MWPRVVFSFLLVITALLALPHAHAQEVGTLTLLRDTPLRVIRGVAVLQGLEGMRLRTGDILETGPAPTAQAQLEFNGGAIVELGPSTQLLISSASAASGQMVLATGWVKAETTAGLYTCVSPLVAATSKTGNILFHAASDSADVFVEKGTATVTGGGAITSAPGKIFFTRKNGKTLIAADRPSGEFIAAMPVSFRDALPPRMPALAGKKAPTPKVDHDVTYADIERWLTAPSSRKALAARFRPRLQDPAFRQAIEAHQSALPDWEPFLHPQSPQTGPATEKPQSPPGE